MHVDVSQRMQMRSVGSVATAGKLVFAHEYNENYRTYAKQAQCEDLRAIACFQGGGRRRCMDGLQRLCLRTATDHQGQLTLKILY